MLKGARSVVYSDVVWVSHKVVYLGIEMAEQLVCDSDFSAVVYLVSLRAVDLAELLDL